MYSTLGIHTAHAPTSRMPCTCAVSTMLHVHVVQYEYVVIATDCQLP